MVDKSKKDGDVEEAPPVQTPNPISDPSQMEEKPEKTSKKKEE